jgi:hypothetical protein
LPASIIGDENRIYVANAADREGESATATSAADGDVQLADASKNPRDTSTCAVRTTDLTGGFEGRCEARRSSVARTGEATVSLGGGTGMADVGMVGRDGGQGVVQGRVMLYPYFGENP